MWAKQLNIVRSVPRFARRFSSQSAAKNETFMDRLKSDRNKGPVTFLTLSITALILSGFAAIHYIDKEKKNTPAVTKEAVHIGKPALGGPWVLVNHDGIPVTDATYRGKFQILYFGFTYCPDICPSELVKIGSSVKLLETAGLGDRIQPLLISVDPTRDTIGQMQHYAQDFHPKVIYLTGTKGQVANAARAYRVYFSKANEKEDTDEDYLVDHSIVFYLVGPDGEFLDFFTQRTNAADIANKIKGYIAEYDAKPKEK